MVPGLFKKYQNQYIIILQFVTITVHMGFKNKVLPDIKKKNHVITQNIAIYFREASYYSIHPLAGCNFLLRVGVFSGQEY